MAATHLKLGVPFDLLFDRDKNKLKDSDDAITHADIHGNGLKGGLRLPDECSSGTGNIVIRGRAGTAKSILGMQLMYQCCTMNDGYYSWFIALEDTPEHVCEKAEYFGWNEIYFPIRLLNDMEELSNPNDYAEALKRALTIKNRTNCSIHACSSNHKDIKDCGHGDHNKKLESRVYLSCLSPRHLLQVKNDEFDIFEERYRQLEKLLWAAESLSGQEQSNSEQKQSKLGMVCIDSLNVFGDRLLTREQLYRLFKLFTKYKVIGVFILEEDEGQVLSPDNRLHADVIEFLADVVISLQYEEDAGYFVRYFEIIKSRYQHQVYGKHPFKIVKETLRENKNINFPIETGIVIFPSIHYVVYSTEKV